MSEPIVFIARQKIKDGQFEAYKRNFEDVVEFVQANKPNTVGFLNFVNEDCTEATLIQVYPSVESWEQHMQGLEGIARKSYESMDLVGLEIYGKPNETVLGMMRNLAKSGVPVKIFPQHIGGFLRLKAD